MPEFLELLPPGDALDLYLERIHVQLPAEDIDSRQPHGRVAYQDIFAPHALPAFDRSSVDGYAVRALDTHGASDSLPAYLQLVGEVRMGESAQVAVNSAECCLIHTGGMLPQGSDAVVMLENTQVAKPGEIEIYRAAAQGENVIRTGEDIQQGEIVIPGGKILNAADIGGVLALGITRIQVVRKPVVGIISTGDEIIPPEEDILPGQIRDINSYSLAALVESAGGRPHNYGIISDQEEPLLTTARQAVQECDLVVITAGSSASNRDLTAGVINKLGQPGVLVHGVNVRPGKPTILAACKPEGAQYTKPIIGLPGNPVSALVIALLFVEPVVDLLLGVKPKRLRNFIQAQVSVNLSSSSGREDWIPVKITAQDHQYLAEPIFGKSNLIFTLARADGLLHIPAPATGLDSGQKAEVLLF
jgi:molybdopterin molybdotransferase